MLRYFVRRILLMIPVLLGVSIIVFLLQAVAPGNPATLQLGYDAPQQAIDEWNAKYDLDKPLIVQYGKYMWNLITKGELGLSYRTGQSVNAEIASRVWVSLKLGFFSTLFAALIGIPLGIVSAKYHGKFLDAFARIFGIAGISLPNFWFAFMMIMWFSVDLKWFPVSGLYGPEYYVLPVAVMAILGSASMLRITRSAILDNLFQDYVRTARAKGQTERRIMSHHIIKNSLIPIANIVGMQFAGSMGGTTVTETVFVITGLGMYLVAGVNNRDYNVLRACVLVIAFTVCVMNLLVDLFYAFVDPRVKAQFAKPGAARKRKRKAEIQADAQ